MSYDPEVVTAQLSAHCFFCGSPAARGATCPTCLVLVANPSLEAVPRPECPRCHGRLLALAFDTGIVLHACAGACRGLFVPGRAWCALVRRPDLVDAIERRLPPRDVGTGALVALVRCPVCATEMERGRFGATSSIVVDVCVKHGQWLDAGELGEVVRYAAHRAKIGLEAAQREAARELALPPSSPELFRQAMEIERARIPSPTASAPKLGLQLKRVGLVVGVVLLVVRLGFYVYAQRSGAVEDTADGARRAAEGAGTALGR